MPISSFIPLALLAVLFAGGSAHAQTNIALGRPVSASGAVWAGQVPANLTDGNLSNQSHPLDAAGTTGFYYEIDLGSEQNLGHVELVNRSGCCPERLSNYRIEVRADAGGSAGAVNWSADIRPDGSNSGDGGRDVIPASLDPGSAMFGRYLRIVNLSGAAYNPQIAEVEAFEAPTPVINFFTVDNGNITATGDPELPDSALLSWSVTNANTVNISPAPGNVALDGEASVTPAVTTTYLLTATNDSGTTTASISVGVDEAVIPPVLTEFMADNASTLDDQFGNSPDWIEIHNPNLFSLSLGGYYLTDIATFPTQWTIPEGTSIPANGYLIIFASGEDLTDPAEPLHTNFSLAKNGEYLALIDRDGSTVLTGFTFPAGKEDVGYGLEADGVTAGFFIPATPGQINGTSFAGFVEDTKFTLPRGFYNTPQSVEITTATPGATIKYTTNGSAPGPTNGSTYSGPITISSTTTLRAMAYLSGLAPTNIDTNTYLFVDDVLSSPELGVAASQQLRDSLTAVPSLSIVTPSTINGTSEVETSFELINPDGTPGFQENCGVRNFGGAFTDFAKKNFRMSFRSKYGASKLKYPLFEGFDHGITASDTFDQLNLRSGSHDMVLRGFYMSNRFTDDTMLDMGNINPHGRFMHLYLNGKYWGVYHVRERWSADTLTEYLDGPKSAYESINGNWNVGGWADSVAPPYDGDGSAWTRIKNLARTSSPTNYDNVSPYLDTQHYVDYMIMWMFGDSEDEYRCVGPADVGSGFKWLLNDADGYLRSAGNRTNFASSAPGVFGRSPGDGPGSLFSLLFKSGNKEFRTLLADRIHKHYFNDGAMTPAKTIPRLQKRCDEMDSPFRTEALRWNYRTHSSWTSSKNAALNNILPPRTASALNQFRSAGFYPTTVAPVFNQHGGVVPLGFNVTLSEGDGTMYFTTDGSDPRLEGGGLNPAAMPYDDGQETTTVIAAGADWSYLDDGSNQGTAWQSPAYDDSSWQTGPAILGYGETAVVTTLSYGPSSSSKYTTTYFRKTVSLSDTASILSGEILVKRDDGAVVYLNGTEIGRSSMPDGTITFQTLANTASDDGRDFHSLPIPASLFVDGDNVIAVEVHQSTLGSSDFQFDLQLNITRPANGINPLSLTGNTLVRSRSLDGGDWSAMNEAFFNVTGFAPVAPGQVVPSEIHYNPAGPDDAEFIELHNRSAQAVNLRGCFFGAGIDFTFPDNRDVILAPGERALVVDSQFGMDLTFGIGLRIIGVYRGSLNNGGEMLSLLAPDGITELFGATFDGADPWPEAADGGGSSLVLTDPSDLNSPASWRPSLALNGTPGTSESTSFGGDPNANLDGDQLTAFQEYAMGTSDDNPLDGLTSPEFQILDDGHWQLRFQQSLIADDVRAIVETSTDLSQWTSDPSAHQLMLTEPTGNLLFRTYRSAAPVNGGQLYVRVRYLKTTF